METIEKLSPPAVQKIVRECLFDESELNDEQKALLRKGEPVEGAVRADGIMRNFVFHAGRIKEHTPAIKALLAQLPDEFHKGKGEGWTFLKACTDREGRLWTGEHAIMEELMCLGLAAGAIVMMMPRDMWSALPGGMPYFQVIV